MSHLILCLEQVLFSIPEPADIVDNPVRLKPGSSTSSRLEICVPELEDVFPLLIVMSHLARSLGKADGHLAVVRDAIARTLPVFIEAQTSFS